MSFHTSTFQPPNEPELTCGNVQPVPCRLLRGRDGCSFQFLLAFARRKSDGWFRQVERLVSLHAMPLFEQ